MKGQKNLKEVVVLVKAINSIEIEACPERAFAFVTKRKLSGAGASESLKWLYPKDFWVIFLNNNMLDSKFL